MSDLEAVIESDPIQLNFFANGVFLGEVGCIHLQRHLKCTPNVQMLELKGSCIGRAGAEYLSVGLRNTQLRHLGIGRNGLDHIGTSMLLKALQSTPIETLDLEWNSLQDGMAPALAALLEVTTTLLSISLERNDLRSDGVGIIADALCKNTSLRNLNLAWNRTGSAAAIKIGEMLQRNKTLLTLNLSQNGIPSEGAKAIGVGMSLNNTLKSLNLQSNQAADSFANFVPSASTGKILFNSSLRELNLGANRLQVAWADRFAKNLATTTNLIGLSLSKCNIGELPMRSILKAISGMSYLSTLDVSGCLLNSKNGPDLSLVLTRCANLGSLILDENRLEDVGVEQFTASLAACSTLTSLSMRSCEVGLDGILALSKAIKARVGLPLYELNLSGNSIDDEACVTLCNALASDGQDALAMLELSANPISSHCAAYLGFILQRHPNLPSITVRDTPLADNMRNSYLTVESVLEFTGGVISEPTVHVLNESRAAVKVVSNSDTLAGSTGYRKTNFNGSSGVLAASSPVAAGSSSSALMRGEDGATDGSGLLAPSASYLSASNGEEDPAVPRGSNATRLVTHVSANKDVFVPGMTPSAPPIKRCHELHRVEDNISALPITDLQLRQKFVNLDKSCCGFVEVGAFLKAYQELDPVSAELPDTRVKRAVQKLCPNGQVGFQEFCILMLKLVNN